MNLLIKLLFLFLDIFFSNYKMVYPRLISLIKWKFDYVFFEKKKKMQRQQILEQLCNKIVDVINEMFTKKYYFVKISQSKKEHVYLVVRKKRGRLFDEKLLHFIERSTMF